MLVPKRTPYPLVHKIAVQNHLHTFHNGIGQTRLILQHHGVTLGHPRLAVQVRIHFGRQHIQVRTRDFGDVPCLEVGVNPVDQRASCTYTGQPLPIQVGSQCITFPRFGEDVGAGFVVGCARDGEKVDDFPVGDGWGWLCW